MARLPGSETILNAAKEWADRCLLDDGSILSSERLWTPKHTAELNTHFVDNLDYGEGDFFSKLEAQLSPASGGARKLAAEMFWVMYLIVSETAIGADTKRFQIRQVWSWSGDTLPEDHPQLGDVLAQGISHPGTAYNTHRWRELRFFITMLADWKQLPRDTRAHLLSKPWEFASWIEGREYAAGRQLRHILLYLLFPDQFERMGTASHKRTVVREFRRKWGEDESAVNYGDRLELDREVLKVRERIASELGTSADGFDFYSTPEVRNQWHPKPKPVLDADTEWPDDAESEAWLQERFGSAWCWLIATGGGGRMWKQFRDEEIVAVDFQSVGDLSEYGSREEIHAAIAEKERRDNPTNDSLAAWQFAREMAVGDVVIAKQGRTRLYGWGVITGDYTYDPERSEYQHTRRIKWRVSGQWDLVGDQRGISTKTLTEFRQYPSWTRWAIERMGGATNQAVPEPPKVTFTHKQALDGLFLSPEQFTTILDSLGRRHNVILEGPPGVGKTFVARRIAYALIGRKEPERVELVQFHQSYSYEDFVQGWRPNEKGGFVLRDGVFKEFCRRAADDPSGEPYVFIIDEINRGNLSRIFGELMMLIETDKRGSEYAIPLTYSGSDRFFVPANVHVLGLMNTADRSLAMVDYALRRRFGFIDLRPAFGTELFKEFLLRQEVPTAIVQRLNDRMIALNEVIRNDRRNLGPGYEIGHSYFVPSGEEENLDETWYRAVIETEIAPLLREYWFDHPAKVDEHLGALLG